MQSKRKLEEYIRGILYRTLQLKNEYKNMLQLKIEYKILAIL